MITRNQHIFFLAGCSSLVSVTIPDSVTGIGEISLMMFFACSRRKEIKLQTPVQDERSGKWGNADNN
jgi:hypothetical protein